MEHEPGVLWLSVVLARVLATANSAPPADIQDDRVLFILRHGAPDGCTPTPTPTPTPDAGMPAGDAGVPDAGTSDAGLPDAGLPDAGLPDAGCTAGDAITMIVQPQVTVDAATTSFAFFYVTPALPTVTLTDDVFTGLEAATAPKVHVTEVHHEDPSAGKVCGQPRYGCGADSSSYYEDTGSWTPPELGDAGISDGGDVEVATVGPYEILRAQPADRAQLAQWLDRYSFTYLPADLDALVPYIARGYTIVAARVAATTPATFKLRPLALSWPGSEIRVPLALSASRDPLASLTVYVAADGTYQVAGAYIKFSGPTTTGPYTYVTRNELEVPQITSPDDDPVATHHVDINFQDVTEKTVEVLDPLIVDCNDNNDLGCCDSRHSVRPDTTALALGVLVVLRRRRRRRARRPQA